MNLFEKIGDQGIVLYQLFFIYNYMIFQNSFCLWMFLLILLNIFINLITKHLFIKYFSKYNHSLPLLGSFCRPIDEQCKDLTITGYGMPSGHSQISTFIASFYYFYYKDNYSISTLFTYSSIAIFIMITRYTSKMHSIPQIIVGSSYGFLLGFLFAKIARYVTIF